MVFFFRVCGVGFGLVFCYGFGGGGCFWLFWLIGCLFAFFGGFCWFVCYLIVFN